MHASAEVRRFKSLHTQIESCLSILRAQYGNTGCGIFKQGVQNQKKMPKNQHTQRKLLNFENWVNGEVSKIGHHFRK